MASGCTPAKSITKKGGHGDDKYCRVCGDLILIHSQWVF